MKKEQLKKLKFVIKKESKNQREQKNQLKHLINSYRYLKKENSLIDKGNMLYNLEQEINKLQNKIKYKNKCLSFAYETLDNLRGSKNHILRKTDNEFKIRQKDILKYSGEDYSEKEYYYVLFFKITLYEIKPSIIKKTETEVKNLNENYILCHTLEEAEKLQNEIELKIENSKEYKAFLENKQKYSEEKENEIKAKRLSEYHKNKSEYFIYKIKENYNQFLNTKNLFSSF